MPQAFSTGRKWAITRSRACNIMSGRLRRVSGAGPAGFWLILDTPRDKWNDY
jgi:hypothetical protein